MTWFNAEARQRAGVKVTHNQAGVSRRKLCRDLVQLTPNGSPIGEVFSFGGGAAPDVLIYAQHINGRVSDSEAANFYMGASDPGEALYI